MKLVVLVRTSGDLTRQFRVAGILSQVARNETKPLGLFGPIQVIWVLPELECFRLFDDSMVP
jgi:hypothetical protein